MSRHLANRLWNSLDQSGNDEALGGAPYVGVTSIDLWTNTPALSELSTNIDHHTVVGGTNIGPTLPDVGIFAGLGDSATTDAAKPVGTITQLSDYLINGYWQYAGYAAHHWGSNTITYNLGNLTASEQALAQSALNLWHEVANLNFVLTTGTANITFNHNGSMVASTGASWNSSTHLMTSATVQISTDWITNDGGAMDGRTGLYSYGFQTYIHEIGHALGLGHQGAYNGSAIYGTDNVYANDTWQYSIMSYFSQNKYDGGTNDYTITPMMADITAVQLIYGAATTRTGNTTYGFNSNAGSVYDFSLYLAYGAPAFTIYDSGGTDTLNCSGYSANQTIDLTPGAFCSIGGYIHNIGIFTTTMIENAVGGTGNDSIYGNSANNTLTGGAGNDVFDGNGGGDILIGNAGADKFIFDAAAYASATTGTPLIYHITDYDQGSNGSYNFAEGDQIDLSALLATAYGSGQATSSLVRAVADPTGTFAQLQIDVDGTANGTNWVTIAQLDGLHINNSLQVILNGTGATGTISVLPSESASRDFNGDGYSDILWYNNNGSVSQWFMNSGAIQGIGNLPTIPTTWHIQGTADFNADGHSDILWRSDSGDISMWFMDGANISTIANLPTIPTSWHIQGTGDFNGDGRCDILWRSDGGDISMWFMNGGTIGSIGNLPTIPTSWHIQGTGDFNADGHDDILWRNEDGAISMWFMDGANISTIANLPTIPTSWHIQSAGDFNGDGHSDILWRSDGGDVSMWLMNGGSISSISNLPTIPTSWQIQDTGDSDGDGKSDILWRSDTGAVSQWLMNGSDIKSIASPPTVDPSWHIAPYNHDLMIV